VAGGLAIEPSQYTGRRVDAPAPTTPSTTDDHSVDDPHHDQSVDAPHND
jgi:hypothetical protein